MNRSPLGGGAPKARGRALFTAVVCLAAMAAASCGAHLTLMTLPAGAGTPAPDAHGVLASASRVCRGVSTLTAEVGVAGSVGGQRVPRVHLLVGISAPAAVRIEASAPLGGAVFIFVTKAGDATLLLSRDNRVLEHGRPGEVLEAVTGVPLDPPALKTAITGCAGSPDAQQALHLGDDWIVMPDGDGRLYLQREKGSGAWRIVAATHAGGAGAWRAEYRDYRGGLPQTIRLSADDRSRFDLALTLSQVDVNTIVDDTAFSVRIPASAAPITIEELRGAGVLQ